jgi:uncharacterized protein (UPF0261 family)
MSVYILATLDTKAAEVQFLREQLLGRGLKVKVVDTGILGEPGVSADIRRAEFFRQAGVRLEQLQQKADRGHAIATAANAAEKLAKTAHLSGDLTGILGLGGSAGTTIASAAMRVLPIGVPKLLISTLASGDVRPYVGTRDICMMYSVVDVSGLNRISRKILNNASMAMAGMLQSQPVEADHDKPIVAATMFGVTTPCVEAAKKPLEDSGYEVLTFHATGVGGRTMEGLIRDGLVRGVLDITTTELADQLVGGVMAAGVDRLTAAAIKGIPQVISVGALDMVNFGPIDTIPERFRQRRLYQHNPTVTLIRTTPEENDQLGKEIAEKACAAHGPTVVVLPLRGVSALDAEGKPFWWPEANDALFQSIRNWIYGVELIEVDANINDLAFSQVVSEQLLKMMR